VRVPPLLPLPLPSRRVTCDQRECSTQHVATAPVLGDPVYSSDRLSYIPGVGVQRGLYLHASHVSFYVSLIGSLLHPTIFSLYHYETLHSRTTSLPSNSHGPRLPSPLFSSSASSIINFTPSFAHAHTKTFHFHIQNYRQRKHGKRFRVGVTAPLPPYFVQACRKLKIPLTDELIDGGVRIDDVLQDVSFLRKGEGTDNDMRWLL